MHEALKWKGYDQVENYVLNDKTSMTKMSFVSLCVIFMTFIFANDLIITVFYSYTCYLYP